MKNASFRRFIGALFVGILLSFVSAASATNTLNYQGRVISGGTAFAGSGQFKFALVSADGSTVYWKNDGTTDAAAPTTSVPLTVIKGIFSVRLGDNSFGNMAAIPSSVFSNTSMALRIWFNDGVKGFQQLSPDSYVDPNLVAAATLTSGATASKTIILTTFPIFSAFTFYTPNWDIYSNIPSNIHNPVTVPVAVRDSSGRGFDVRYQIERSVKKITKISGSVSNTSTGCQSGLRIIKISPTGTETVLATVSTATIGSSIPLEATLNEFLNFEQYTYFVSAFANAPNGPLGTATINQVSVQIEE